MKKKIASPVKSLRSQEAAYQKELGKLGKALAMSVRENVLTFLKANQAGYVLDGVGDQIGAIFERMNHTFLGVTMGFSRNIAEGMVSSVSAANKDRFNRSVARATGINMGSIIEAEGLEDFVTASINKNVSLIKSLPEQYLSQVETIVNNGLANGSRYDTIAKEITARTGSANAALVKRIKTIARNEVSTINAQITLRRSKALGIKRGIWRTSEDERVRGNPSGKYPNARPSHWRANGKEFDLAKGLKVDGEWIMPGIPINCRCSYSPIIEVE